MAKKIKQANKPPAERQPEAQSTKKAPAVKSRENKGDYWWSMSYAPGIDQSIHWFQLLPLAFFTAVVIMITRMATYTRPMDQFYWISPGNDLTDFFSYYKMIFILIMGALALVFFAYRVFTQSLAIKRSIVYIPMGIYALFTVISYFLSDYKEFALLGWNDRFEGTLVLLAYMVMLFYAINTINTEKAVKWILYPLGVTSGILGLLGISQAIGKDFFQTSLGQKLLVPNAMTDQGATIWQLIDQATMEGRKYLSFTFQNNEIYQTVYNINYVSFYLTLLIPLFGLLFIHCCMKGKAEPIWKKLLWGGLFALLMFNLVGSASSGGFLGMGVVVILAVIVLNKKILKWLKPLAVLVVIAILIGGLTHERWLPDIILAFHGGMTDTETTQTEEAPLGKLDSLVTNGDDIILEYNHNKLTISTVPEDFTSIKITDSDGKNLDVLPTEDFSAVKINDPRFENIVVRPAMDETSKQYVVVTINGTDWPFNVSDQGVQYMNGFGKLLPLSDIPSVGFEENPTFGSGRGYIWSRTIPMMEKTALVGHGADTYCIYFPHNDYVGKVNSGTFSSNVNIIVDKPHNMYMGMWVGTGGISVIAFLALLVIYGVQSIGLFWRSRFRDFLDFAGAGIFLGIVGFAVTGLVDDSSVSTMPMFYGLLGTGIAINMILKRQYSKMKPEKE